MSNKKNTTKLRSIFLKNFNFYREQKKLSYADLASKCKVSRQHMYQVGKVAWPSDSLIELICTELEITYDQLFSETL